MTEHSSSRLHPAHSHGHGHADAENLAQLLELDAETSGFALAEILAEVAQYAVPSPRTIHTDGGSSGKLTR